MVILSSIRPIRLVFVFVDLVGLVVCAKDGLDVDLLVSSSLDGWEEESDLLEVGK